MSYSFKEIKLSDSEKLWLKEIYETEKFDIKKAKVKLWGKLSKDFKPQKIDYRLFRDNHLTLIGIWHVYPDSPVFEQVDKIIISIKELLFSNPGVDKVTAIGISKRTGIRERDVEIGLYLMSEMGRFFSSATGVSTGIGYSSLSFSADQYDEYLEYNNLNDLMESFYSWKPPELSTPLEDLRMLNNQKYSLQNKDIWSDIEKDYDLTKEEFSIKINFVKDDYGKETIFRDVEHAYILAQHGFSKPAVILAGSVIEELLRQYLKYKEVTPSKDTFDEYIKTCKDNDLLKSAIHSLTDFVRHFRNLVHLAKEKSVTHAISKATAKGAVASIFTIANDFS